MASLISSAATASINRTGLAQAGSVAPFAGLKSSSAFPVTQKNNNDITSLSSNGGRVQCIQVWPPVGLKIETLSYLAPLTHESLAKDVDYLIHNGWVPCLEFELEPDSCTVRTTGHPGTMMAVAGQCERSPCLVPLTHHRF